MEKLNVEDPKSWVYVKMLDKFNARYNFHAISIDETTALVFGGYDEKGNRFLKESYLIHISVDGASCEKGCKLVEDSGFSHTAAPVFDGENVYAVDNDQRIHIYSI